MQRISERDRTHWLIRVGDGKNFRNSTFPFWAVKSKCNKSIIHNRFNKGDILWFLTSKANGGDIIAMAEYKEYYDRTDEPLLQINTVTDREQNWKGKENHDIEIHYKNLYITEKKTFLKTVIQCPAVLLEYETFKDKGLPDLDEHYKGFIKYAETINFN